VEDGQPLIADSPLYGTVFWIFNSRFIRVSEHWVPSISPASVLEPILLKANVSGHFQRFMALWGPDFKVDFSTICDAGFKVGWMVK
jgi:hypothetical protein